MTVTTSSPKSYNYMALRGGGFDDMEYVVDLGMPEEYAYTPKIGEWMIEKTRKENIDWYTSGKHKDEAGNRVTYSQEQAEAKANAIAKESLRDYRELLAKNGMLK